MTNLRGPNRTYTIALLVVGFLLLVAIPFGTVVGIYGLWKVDRPALTLNT